MIRKLRSTTKTIMKCAVYSLFVAFLIKTMAVIVTEKNWLRQQRHEILNREKDNLLAESSHENRHQARPFRDLHVENLSRTKERTSILDETPEHLLDNESVSSKRSIKRDRVHDMRSVQEPIDLVYLWVNGSDVNFLLQRKLQKMKDKSLSAVRCVSAVESADSVPVLVLHPAIALTDSKALAQAGIQARTFFTVQSDGHEFTVVTLHNQREVDRILNSDIKIMGQQHVGFCGVITTVKTKLTRATVSDHFFLHFKQQTANSNDMDTIWNDFNIDKTKVTKCRGGQAVLVQTSPIVTVRKIKDYPGKLQILPAFVGWDYFDFSADHAVTENRVAEKDELKYSLRSVERFAPWIRHIYVVTNDQVPSWLNTAHPKITVLSTETVFPNKSHLPSFNSAAIESHLYQIPNVSRSFLFMCDDFLFGSTVSYEDFYTRTEGYKLYVEGPIPDCSKGCYFPDLGTGICNQACNTARCHYDHGDCGRPAATQRSPDDQHSSTFEGSLGFSYGAFNRVFGYSYRRTPTHMPILLDKDIAANLYRTFKHDFDGTSSHHFRSNDDMQYSFSYNNFVMENSVPGTPSVIFQAADIDQSGDLCHGELFILSDILRRKRGRIKPTSPADSERSKLPVDEIVKQCLFGDVTRNMTSFQFESCVVIMQYIRVNRPSVSKYRYTLKSGRQVYRNYSFISLTNDIARVDLTLKRLLQYPTKFIAINDDVNYYRSASAANVQTLLRQFYDKLFPQPSTFEKH